MADRRVARSGWGNPDGLCAGSRGSFPRGRAKARLPPAALRRWRAEQAPLESETATGYLEADIGRPPEGLSMSAVAPDGAEAKQA